MPTVTGALRSFLRARRVTHNGPDLLDRWTPAMETQVNVAAGKGEPVAGKRNTFTNGIDEWWNIRIPKNAHADPEFHDYEMTWPLDLHTDAVGCTGWDWQARRSRWVGFDFDSIKPYEPEPEPQEVTVYDIRFPWEVPPQAPLRQAKPLIRDPVFQVAMLAGVIVGGLWCWWG